MCCTVDHIINLSSFFFQQLCYLPTFTNITSESNYLFCSLSKPPPPPPPPPPDKDDETTVVLLVNAKPNADAATDKKDARGNGQDGRSESSGEKFNLAFSSSSQSPSQNCRERESCNSALHKRSFARHFRALRKKRVRIKSIARQSATSPDRSERSEIRDKRAGDCETFVNAVWQSTLITDSFVLLATTANEFSFQIDFRSTRSCIVFLMLQQFSDKFHLPRLTKYLRNRLSSLTRLCFQHSTTP